ncbi:MAG: hypothetical protein KGQ83_05460, partial [Planctomycetes bacterium]|nr:hypothetical protein [Planctomycetota bacterium]
MNSQKLLKIIGGIAAAILLGAIGSGVWERILSPGLNGFYRISVNVISSISLNYKDAIYKSAAKGFHETYSFRVFGIIGLLLVLAALFLVLVYINFWNTNRTSHFFAAFSNQWLRWQATVVCLAFALAVMYGLQRHYAINKTVTYAIRSTDILRPKIGEQKYFELLAEFYQIRTAKQFYSFNEAIIQQAHSYG